jgi:hypothetical protein
MTKAARMMPTVTAAPIWVRKATPASSSDPKAPARITPAETTEGPACSTARSAAARGSWPAAASSRRRAIIRML